MDFYEFVSNTPRHLEEVNRQRDAKRGTTDDWDDEDKLEKSRAAKRAAMGLSIIV